MEARVFMFGISKGSPDTVTVNSLIDLIDSRVVVTVTNTAAANTTTATTCIE